MKILFIRSYKSPYFLASALILLATVIIFLPIIFGKHTLFFGDNLSLKIPSAIFSAREIKNGNLPTWNPHILAGVPFLEDLANTVFYPNTLFFLVFEPFTALNFATIFSVFLSGIFMYFLCKQLDLDHDSSLVSSLVFLSSATLLHYTSYLNLISASIWLPLTLGLLVKSFKTNQIKWIIFAVFSQSLQIMAGHPQPTFYSLVFITGFTLFVCQKPTISKRIQYLVLFYLTFFLLTLFILVPAWQLSQQSTRSIITFEQATSDSLHPALLIRLILPSFFDNSQLGYSWGPSWRKVSDNTGYIGIATLLLSAISIPALITKQKSKKITIFLLSSIIASLIISFGKFTPVFKIFFETIPVFNKFRGPAEALYIFTFAGAVLSGLSLNQLKSSKIILPKLILVSLVLVGVFALTIYFISTHNFELIYRQISAFHTLERDRVILKALSLNIFVSCAILLSTVYALKHKRFFIILLIVFLDLYLGNSRYIFTLPKVSLTNLKPSFSQPDIDNNYRLLSYQDLEPFTGLGNYWENMSLRPPFADTFFTDEEKNSGSILRNRINDLSANWNMVYKIDSPNGYNSYLLTNYVNYLGITQNAPLNSPDLSNLTEEQLDELSVGYYLNSNSTLTKRPSSHSKIWSIDQDENKSKTLSLTTQTANSYTIQVSSDAISKLIISSVYYPGWEVYVDGVKSEIQTHKNLFLGVNLSPGDHEVVFRYVPKIFYQTLPISIFTLIFCILVISFSPYFEKKNVKKN